MLLLLDIGNTHTHLGLSSGEKIRRQTEVPTRCWRSRTARPFIEQFVGKNKLDGAAMCSVVPSATKPARALLKSLRLPFVELTNRNLRGIGIDYPKPASIGPDRLANALAARTFFGAPAVVVDFGTATTFNVISEKNEFLGGAISPGLLTCAEALFQRAAKLPRVEFARPRAVIGSSTVEAMQSGIYYGYAGLVDGMLEQMLDEIGWLSQIVATGGLAPLIEEASQHIETIDQTLTLDGLRIVYERNRTERGSVV